jgi:hypothetical protein
MVGLRIGASAERDLLIGFEFYESQAVGLGQYFLDSLIADIDALALYAGMHPKPLAGLHRSLSKRFPFAISTISTAELRLSLPCSTVVATHVRFAVRSSHAEPNP